MPISRLALTRRRLLCSSATSLAALMLGVRPAIAGTDPSQALLARLCDIVIPDTDTPGARAAGVPAFLPFAFSHDLFGGNANTLAALTSHLDARAGGSGFLAADPAAQLRIVTALDQATFLRAPPPPEPLPTQGSTKPLPSISAPVDNESQRLWRIVKSGIVTSFYTSESGGSRTLAYELVPGRYDADIPLHSEPYLSNFWIENTF
jgi:hypothetical protein